MWTFQLVSQTQQLDMVSLVFQAAVPKYITMDKIKNNMLGTKSLMIKLGVDSDKIISDRAHIRVNESLAAARIKQS